MSKRVLITGTTGGIGGALKSAALENGYEVKELNRADDFAALPEGVFDAVIFSTGMNEVKSVTQLSDESFMEMMRVNCGLFLKLVRSFVKEKRYAPGAKVIAISSISATEGWAGGVGYCASKGALSAMCRALDAELKPRGISVLALEPKYVNTRMFANTAGRMGVSQSQAKSPEAFAADVLEMIK